MTAICYAPVLKAALEKAAGDRYHFVDETGTPMDELLKKYIDRDMPKRDTILTTE